MMQHDEALRIGGLAYGFALIVLGIAVLVTLWKAAAPAAALAREVAAALREHSAALRGTAIAPERLERLESQVTEIHARVCRPPPPSP